MIIALYIALAIVGVGAVLWALDRRHRSDVEPEPATEPEQCCGMHITCERDSLLANVSDSIEYFDDEELDAFSGRQSDSYTDDEAELFSDVLYTMRQDEVAAWCRSLHLRGIELPDQIKDEVYMLRAN